MLANVLRRMTTASTLRRTGMVAQHMLASSTASPATEEAPVLFESNLGSRTYILNRPKKLNALNEPMLNILRPLIEEWNQAELCRIIIGRGVGRAFCAGGDVQSVVEDAENVDTRPRAIDFFKREFEMDYVLANLEKPYVAVCDGITMGGGVGLSAHASFRVATERTRFSMPETNIGYVPDVGSNHFLSRLDGELGTYLALTGTSIFGRAVFELGLATHFVPSRRIPQLLAELSLIETPGYEQVDSTIEEHWMEREAHEPVTALVGDTRVALDSAFRHNTVEEIVQSLEKISQRNIGPLKEWAEKTLAELAQRSPTSLKVALEAIRRGKNMQLHDVLQMELNIATAYCSNASPDFRTGVFSLLRDKIPAVWSPARLSEVNLEQVVTNFFNPESPFLVDAPKLDVSPKDADVKSASRFALPTETEIQYVLQGQGSSGNLGYDLPTFINKFDSLRNGKRGVEEKIREVVARRCEVVKSNTGYEELRWKSK